MDALLSVVDEDQLLEAGHDVDTTIKATCIALILAGTETTTGTLTWALALMLNNPQVLSKAQHELDTKIGRERLATESDLTKLEYLDAILKETLRLYPPAPLNLPHESMEDCTVGGYHIPAGTRLLTNISKLHRDPRVYSDPTLFRPERFLEEHKGLGMKGQNFEFIPFGAGRRMCPGLSFALQSMQLILANLLHAFHVVNPRNGPVDMSEEVGITNIKASPLQVLLKSRLSSLVYG
ncbi:hypothetical protein L6164_008498 [Bauhinia variegata]|uniref:Uncharacterized protein n=1 Tax=Bauhinia variegata TaxID=167791 RepID=A0ACB9PFU1_BAUVA|nr:hypothetical protein L6164_008498 [Bauhinia variegata]